MVPARPRQSERCPNAGACRWTRCSRSMPSPSLQKSFLDFPTAMSRVIPGRAARAAHRVARRHSVAPRARPGGFSYIRQHRFDSRFALLVGFVDEHRRIVLERGRNGRRADTCPRRAAWLFGLDANAKQFSVLDVPSSLRKCTLLDEARGVRSQHHVRDGWCRSPGHPPAQVHVGR